LIQIAGRKKITAKSIDTRFSKLMLNGFFYLKNHMLKHKLCYEVFRWKM